MRLNREVKEWGSSLGIIIPAKEAHRLKLKKGETVQIELLTKRRLDGFGIAKKAPAFKREEIEHDIP